MRQYSRLLLLVLGVLSNVYISNASTFNYKPPSYIDKDRFFEGSGDILEEDLNSIRKDLEKVDKASVADKLGSVLEDLKEMENFEKLVSNDIDAKNEEISNRYGRKLNDDFFNISSTETPKIKHLIPTSSEFLPQRLIPRRGRTIGGKPIYMDDIEEEENDDSENRRIEESFSSGHESDSIDSTSTDSNSDSQSSDSDSSSTQESSSKEDKAVIETDEGSGSDTLIEVSTEAPKSSILTADILNRIEEASTEGPSTSSNFAEQNFEQISTSSILEETAESLVASSETKPATTIMEDDKYESSITKHSIVLVASCISGVVLLAVIGLVYMVNFQRQTGTLDIEMQEQRCGKDSYDEEGEDETHERLLGTPTGTTVATVDDIL